MPFRDDYSRIMRRSPEKMQRQYYRDTAERYDDVHVSSEDEHFTALRFISTFMDLLSISSVLDVGSGTGRAVKYFSEKHPSVMSVGIEPVWEMLYRAQEKLIPVSCLICGDGYRLPFADASFDAVCEFGMLHHVASPVAVVKEMLRVARKAVFISDGNRFGQGNRFLRVLKLILYQAGLWGIANWLKTAGRGYTYSEGDGVAWSYSVFDSYETVSEWADRIVLIPTEKAKGSSWFHPLLTSGHILLCGIKG